MEWFMWVYVCGMDSKYVLTRKTQIVDAHHTILRGNSAYETVCRVLYARTQKYYVGDFLPQ